MTHRPGPAITVPAPAWAALRQVRTSVDDRQVLDPAAVPAASAAAEQAGLPGRRVAHSLAVGRRAADLAGALGWPSSRVGWMQVLGTVHDLGCAAPSTGMHALDGARVLRAAGLPMTMCAQVAWHSTAWWEVEALTARGQHGLREQLQACGDPDPLVRDVLWVADFTTSPDGAPVTTAQRCAEIRRRYPTGSAVVDAWLQAQHLTGEQLRFLLDLLDRWSAHATIGGRSAIGHGRLEAALTPRPGLPADLPDWRPRLTQERPAVLEALRMLT